MKRQGVRIDADTKAAASDYYVDGNTVRRTRSVPEHEQEYVRRRQREQIEREKEEAQRRKRQAARRNQERELRMSRSYVAFLGVAVLIFGIFTGTYIKLQSELTAIRSDIATKRSELSELKAENDEAYKRISTSVDLSGVKEKALTEYGMSYAKQGQIQYYSVNDDDYMNQYGEIPEK